MKTKQQVDLALALLETELHAVHVTTQDRIRIQNALKACHENIGAAIDDDDEADPSLIPPGEVGPGDDLVPPPGKD